MLYIHTYIHTAVHINTNNQLTLGRNLKLCLEQKYLSDLISTVCRHFQLPFFSPDQQPDPTHICLENPALHPASGVPIRNLSFFTVSKACNKASLCPIRKAKHGGACYTPCAEEVIALGRRQCFKDVHISGEHVTSLFGSGRFLTLVRWDLAASCVLKRV